MSTNDKPITANPWAALRNTTAYEKLLRRLRHAKGETADNEVRLVGPEIALMAVYDFLRTNPDIIAERLAEPLSALALAVADHLKGTRNPLLDVCTRDIKSDSERAGPGRGLKPSRDVTKGAAIHITGVLMAGHGMKLPDAAAIVAKLLKKQRDNENVTATTIINWGREIGGRASATVGDVERQLRREWEEAGRPVGRTPEETARSMLKAWLARGGF
jgi:hypothetical protein